VQDFDNAFKMLGHKGWIRCLAHDVNTGLLWSGSSDGSEVLPVCEPPIDWRYDRHKPFSCFHDEIRNAVQAFDCGRSRL
jgi:hypothetical protein